MPDALRTSAAALMLVVGMGCVAYAFFLDYAAIPSDRGRRLVIFGSLGLGLLLLGAVLLP